MPQYYTEINVREIEMHWREKATFSQKLFYRTEDYSCCETVKHNLQLELCEKLVGIVKSFTC